MADLSKPEPAPTHPVGHPVGACGCGSSCGCGCQSGGPCQCGGNCG
ncbi:hypothetical protein CFP59_05130 [Streptomyces malaysiensis subsp. malaysiensis]|nr:hypothetical protein CFP59_05130 [Streptomyces sp. M56]SCF68329.1 hypothetical protein GA0115260_101121 [Streptomyces sp. MnatMP-M27]